MVQISKSPDNQKYEYQLVVLKIHDFIHVFVDVRILLLAETLLYTVDKTNWLLFQITIMNLTIIVIYNLIADLPWKEWSIILCSVDMMKNSFEGKTSPCSLNHAV